MRVFLYETCPLRYIDAKQLAYPQMLHVPQQAAEVWARISEN